MFTGHWCAHRDVFGLSGLSDDELRHKYKWLAVHTCNPVIIPRTDHDECVLMERTYVTVLTEDERSHAAVFTPEGPTARGEPVFANADYVKGLDLNLAYYDPLHRTLTAPARPITLATLSHPHYLNALKAL